MLSFALQSILHRKSRAFLTVVGVGVATSMMISALSITHGYERSLSDNIEMMGYQVLITGKGCPHEAATLILRGGSIPMYIDERVFQRVLADPLVDGATRFFMQSLPGEMPGAHQVFTGVDERFLALAPGVTLLRGSWFESDLSNEVILGYNVAEYKRLNIKDHFTVLNQRLTVCGILDKLGTQYDGTVFLPLTTAQRLFDKRDRLTGIGVRLKDVNQAAVFIEGIYDLPGTQVITMPQVRRSILNVLNGARTLLMTMTVLGLAVAALAVMNVSLISVHEQRGELGISRALGCSRGDLFKLVWAESLILSMAGAALGSVLTLVLRGLVEGYVHLALPFVPAGRVVTVTPGTIAVSGAVVVALGLLGGVYPAWRASVMTPLGSIRGAM